MPQLRFTYLSGPLTVLALLIPLSAGAQQRPLVTDDP
jgi:hypothetical protein